jgi:hypothetical protein
MKRLITAIAVIGLLLASCTGNPTAEVLPTLIPTPGAATPPSQTPVPEQPTVPPTAEPLTRPTLPPTWTPDSVQLAASGVPTVTPEVSATPIIVATVMPTLVVCAGFVADRANSTSQFKIGTTPQVFWGKVDTAARYRIRLLDESGTQLFVDFALEPTYTFKADLFEKNKVYAWSVYPEDSLGQQMCTERGAELYPQP